MNETPAHARSQDPPYPADTRAKGWRFELDLERVRQSDTWALASPELRPWLFMLWATAWEQSPCGSLPADEALIVARIGMPARLWPKARGVLMRGWTLASDGRLYHATLTERVLAMLDYRAKNAKRVADFKARMREQQASNALPQGDSPAKNDTGTGTGTVIPQQDKPVGERGKRATRKCPQPFVVTDAMREWATDEVPTVNLDTETAKFLDYTFKSAITDWLGTWRNWMRKAADFGGTRGVATSPRHAAQASHHSGFASKDYREGITADGTLL